MLKKFNRLLALAAVLFTGSGLQAETPAVVPNRSTAPTAGGDRNAVIDRMTRKRALANARAAAAVRAQAALKAKGGKVDPAKFGVNPTVAIAEARNAQAQAQAQAQAKAAGLAGGGREQGIVVGPGTGTPGPGFQLKQPDYIFNTASNWHNTKPIHKFVDGLPGLTAAHANNLGNFIPVAKPMANPFDTTSDYYEIGVQEYTQKLHSELNATKLRGYRDLNPAAESTVNGTNNSNYLGPVIIAKRDRAVRVKMTNQLPFGPVNPLTGRRPGDLFLPVDTTMDGAGVGSLGGAELFTQNRAEFHLHGGLSPWISDGTPHQWNTPAGEATSYQKGASNRNVPDMGVGTPGDGMTTYYWTNQQSGRFMFYHDHSFGLTRLNVYAGEAAGYLIVDPIEEKLIDAGVIPNNGDPTGVYRYGIPLIIQDKTFVDTSTLGVVGDANPDPVTGLTRATDPTWDVNAYGGDGSLWYPHAYMVNQSPADPSGANNFGRWDYGPWFWPPVTTGAGLIHGEQPVPGDLNGTTYPGTPNPSMVPEAFMDTPVINGAAYPILTVQPKSYRFRILNAADDRFLNLSLFLADPLGNLGLDGKPTEVKMVAAAPLAPGAPVPVPNTWPDTWPTDGRDGGVPDPTTAGPSLIQIGNESGFLPAPTVIVPQPVGYNYNRRDIVVLNVQDKSLFLLPAMRADVIVDFSAYAGKRLILYNDSPAPAPAFDPRIDYYTGSPDQRDSGGAAPTLPGFGPNTRTIMAIDVAAATPDPVFDLAKLNAAFTSTDAAQGAFAATQHPPIIPQMAYNSAMNTTVTKDVAARISDFRARSPFPSTENGDLVQPYYEAKAIQEDFELNYGRMNATLGVELPYTNFNIQTTIILNYTDPVTENLVDGTTQFWKITHNGVDTHPVHFHLFDVQIMNRVGWDGMIKMPAANEYGWRETVQMNPLEDVVVAFRPISPRLPFKLTNSSRSLNVIQPASANLSVTNPADGNPIIISNAATDFGWEYVWHCHILGHEENDFMRPMILDVATAAPNAASMLTAVVHATATNRVDLTWTDNASNETGFSIQRRPAATAGAFIETATVVPNVRSYSDYGITPGSAYDYQVVAYNQAGNSAPSNGAAVNTVPATLQVSGTVGNAVGLVATVTFTNTNPVVTATTNPTTGAYTATVPYLYSGNIVPSLLGYYFFPVNRSLTNINVAQIGQDFTAIPANLITISGKVTNSANAAVGGVTVSLTGQPDILTTGIGPLAGTYSFTVTFPYTGTLTATKLNTFISPVPVNYTNAVTAQIQNFLAQPPRTVSGRVTNAGVNLAGVTMTFTSTNPVIPPFTAVTTGGVGANPNYSHIVPSNLPLGWSGTITPSLAGYVFLPAAITLTNVTTNSGARNFTARRVVTISGQITSNVTSLNNVVVTASGATGGTDTTDRTGTYSLLVTYGWTGTITAVPPAATGWVLSPAPLATLTPGGTVTVITPVILAATQNFIGIQNIAGVALNGATGVNVPGVTITASGIGAVLTNTATSGNNYSIWVPTGWSGTITPSGPLAPLGLPAIWTPISVGYTNLYVDVSKLSFSGN